MLAHSPRGNRADGLRVYHRCREFLRDELGVAPSSETEALYLALLRQSAWNLAGTRAEVRASNGVEVVRCTSSPRL